VEQDRAAALPAGRGVSAAAATEVSMSSEQGLSDAILRANLGALWARSERLFNLAYDPPANARIATGPSGNGLPNLYWEDDAGQVHAWYDYADPLAGVARDLPASVLEGGRLAVVLGMGLGYELVHLFEELAPAARLHKILVIEPDIDVFRHAVRQVDLVTWLAHPSIHLLVGESGGAAEARLDALIERHDLVNYTRRLRFIQSPGAMRWEPAAIRDALQYTARSFRHTFRKVGIGPAPAVEEVRGGVGNLARWIASASPEPLKGAAAGETVVVCSAGPSLSSALPSLRAIRDKVVVVAADGALAALVSGGVAPDIVVAVDPSPLIRHHVEAFDLPNTWLFGHSIMHPEAIGSWRGPLAGIGDSGKAYLYLGAERDGPPPGMSGGNTAFQTALWLGAAEVVLMGQDLAFGPDGTSHAVGTRHWERGLLEGAHIVASGGQHGGQWVPGNNGSNVLTKYDWAMYLADYAKKALRAPMPVINTSLTGARIEGTQVESAESVAQRLSSRPDGAARRVLAALQPPAPARVLSQARDALAYLDAFRELAPLLQQQAGAWAQQAKSGLAALRESEFAGMAPFVEEVATHPLVRALRHGRFAILNGRDGRAELFLRGLRYVIQPLTNTVVSDYFEFEAKAATAHELARMMIQNELMWFTVAHATVQALSGAFEGGRGALEALVAELESAGVA